MSDANPVGRPTKYDPAYCERVLEWGRLGKSKAWMAAEIGVVRQTLEDWGEVHPEFLDALSRAGTLSQQWWEDAGQSGMGADKFNGPVWARSMAARFPDDWRESTKQELSGTLRVEKIEDVIVDPKHPSDTHG